MKKSLFVLLLLFSLYNILDAIELIDRPLTGRQFETLSFRFEQNLKFDNPFDQEKYPVELIVRQPDSSKKIISFFYNGLNKKNVERWEARFSPKQIGVYQVQVRINGSVQANFDVPVESNKGKKLGGLKISDQLGVFRYESGEAFRGIGINVCWADDYDYYFKKMRDAGMNMTRIWMCPWNLSFEWTETGLGRYSLKTAQRLDTILQLAKKYDIFVILCIDFHGIAPKGLGFFKVNLWLENPYNKVNGGPCVDRADLFTNEEAKAQAKKKYKYIVSRYGHSANIAAWEFFNEADLMAGKALPMNRWHVEMAEYVKSIDVHDRLVSSSSTRRYSEKLVDAFRSPAMDFVMFHDYNMLDVAPHFTYMTEAGIEYYQKPIVIAEYGIEYRGGSLTHKFDPQNIGLHNGMWAGLFNETPILPLSWWWDECIDLYNLWYEFANLSRFAELMDINAANIVFKTLESGRLEENPKEQAACMVRGVYMGKQCALWFKSSDYRWSLASEGKEPKDTKPFIQTVPDLTPGRYSITWYDPQTGKFFDKTTETDVKEDGILSISIPSLSKDLACLLTRKP